METSQSSKQENPREYKPVDSKKLLHDFSFLAHGWSSKLSSEKEKDLLKPAPFVPFVFVSPPSKPSNEKEKNPLKPVPLVAPPSKPSSEKDPMKPVPFVFVSPPSKPSNEKENEPLNPATFAFFSPPSKPSTEKEKENEKEKELPWNLRKRVPWSKHGADCDSNPSSRNGNAMKLVRIKNPLVISLTEEEIEADFLAMTGKKPPRKPNRRPKQIQNKIDEISPGKWLTQRKITADLYKVKEEK